MESDPVALITQLLHAVEAAQWLLVVPLAVLVAVTLTRRLLARAIPWVATDQGGAVLGLVAAAAQSVVAATLLPGPHTVVGVVTVALPIFVANEVVFRSLRKLGVDLSVDPPAQFEAPKSPSGVARVLVPLLLLATLTSASGCAWWQKQHELQADLSACATGVVVSEVEALMGEAATALQQNPVDWDRHLDQLVARGGQAALCAILALADALSGGTGGSQTDPLGDYDRATRAAYLRAYARGVAGR
jgi:hypothetical protein